MPKRTFVAYGRKKERILGRSARFSPSRGGRQVLRSGWRISHEVRQDSMGGRLDLGRSQLKGQSRGQNFSTGQATSEAGG